MQVNGRKQCLLAAVHADDLREGTSKCRSNPKGVLKQFAGSAGHEYVSTGFFPCRSK